MPNVGPGPWPVAGSAPRSDPALIEQLRLDLAAFTVEAIDEVLGPLAGRALRRDQLLPAVRACASSTEPVATLAAAFLLGRPVPRRRLSMALPRLGVDGAARLCLVVPSGLDPDDEVRPAVDLRPVAIVDQEDGRTWWLASDLHGPGRPAGPREAGNPGGPDGAGALPVDHVLGVGGASLSLARWTIRSPVRRVLDLGTGSGVQALHAARHSSEITATDVSRRALAFARFTWALNEPSLQPAQLTLRHGSMLDPVQGEQFDLVVSNPPFVVTPRVPEMPTYTYRDAGGVGDAALEHLVTSVGEVLAPGGVAQLLGNWEHRRDVGWAERVHGWLVSSGLDGWVVQRGLQDPAEYAETWLRDGGEPPGERLDRLYGAWLEDFERRGVEGVGFGLVMLARPGPDAVSAQPWRRVEEVPDGALGPDLGAHAAAVLRAQQWLAARDDDALAVERVTVAPDVTEERHHRPGEADPAVILLRQGGGLGRVLRVGTEVAAVVGSCDGDLPLGVLITAVAQLLDEPADQVAGQVLPQVRELVATGLLLPA